MSQDISTERLGELIEAQQRQIAGADFNGMPFMATECRAILPALLELKRRREEDRWIPVTEQLPPTRTLVLGARDGDEVFTLYSDRNQQFWLENEPIENVTRWRSIPSAPKES